MKNPFLYGQSVTGEHFCNRTKELKDIKRHILSGQNLFIYSHRRLGKTSLVREAIGAFSGKKVVSIFVDMERIASRGQFVEVYSKAIATAFTRLDAIKRVRSFFSSIIPRFEFSPEGEISVSVEFAKSESSLNRCMDEVMELPQKLAKRYKKRVAVVFDEFQEVAALDGKGFEKYLRSFIQHHRDVCYIFMGSKASALIEMFNDPKRAFYRSAAVYPLRTIPAEEMEKHIVQRFLDTGKRIGKGLAAKIVETASGLPHYIQMLAWHVWELCEGEAAEGNIEEAVEGLLLSQGELFHTWYDGSTLGQKAVLRALALEERIFSSKAIADHDLGAASNVQSAIKSLVKRGLVNKEGASYRPADPFFALWLGRR